MIQSLESSKLTLAVRKCIEECLNCYAACLNTATEYCLEIGGDHVEASHLRLMLECAETCRFAADLMLRASESHSEACRLCSAICEKCAEDCNTFKDDARMRSCGNACNRCAESCREMAET